MKSYWRVLPLLATVSLLGGCRYKGWESFTSATGPVDASVPYPVVSVQGDPYSFGSKAPANGGLTPETNYGFGASLTSTGKLYPLFDQPEMGSGQQPGEYSTAAAAGNAEDNGPALQPQPGDMKSGNPLAHG
jgi:hypothetical protein